MSWIMQSKKKYFYFKYLSVKALGLKEIVAYNFNDVLSAKRPFKRSDTIHFYT